MGWRRACSTAAISIVLAASCGDDDSGGGGAANTGLPPDQKLSELDTADAEQACNALVDGLDGVLSEDDVERINCNVAAITQSVMPTSSGAGEIDLELCKDLADRCLGGESIGQDGESPLDFDFSQDIHCDAAQVSADLADCDATVSEYESCIDGWLAEIDRVFSSINCDSLRNLEDVQETFGQGFDMDSIEQCDALQSKCPDLSIGPEPSSSGEIPGEQPGGEQPGGGEPSASGCDETCLFSDDSECDDGGPGSDTDFCALGTDCTDCGQR